MYSPAEIYFAHIVLLLDVELGRDALGQESGSFSRAVAMGQGSLLLGTSSVSGADAGHTACASPPPHRGNGDDRPYGEDKGESEVNAPEGKVWDHRQDLFLAGVEEHHCRVGKEMKLVMGV